MRAARFPSAFAGLELGGPRTAGRPDGREEGWIIVMKRRWTGWLPRAARVKSSGGFCCVNCALVIHCSPPFHAVSRYHLKSCCRGTEPTPAPLRQTINGLFAGNGMAIDRFRTRTKEPRVPPLADRRNRRSLSEGGCSPFWIVSRG